ncbi:uncharacterized protein LOC107620413 [Arachis ipaensis]|uniref:uncharacterized protein LOC107620413 n=1 Tax=Arachis ipaensis TaxID=130454 RepID=UPI0007AEFC19|nr:uncharacterized protein LOC107620413 [Arachis ipaensis]
MKDILSHKKDWREVETVVLTEDCSVVIQKNLLEKLQDPGSFMIPCTLGDACIRMALCDLGESINLIPALLIKQLCLTQEVKPTRICLQLADGSIKFPLGVVEDMITRHPDTLEEYMSIDIIDSLVEEVNIVNGLKEKLEDILYDVEPDLKAPEERKETLKGS